MEWGKRERESTRAHTHTHTHLEANDAALVRTEVSEEDGVLAALGPALKQL